jgi:hypothetical protein
VERREGPRLAVKFPGYRTTWTVDLNKHDVRVREQEQEQEHGQEQEQEGDLVNLAAYEREEEEPDDMPLAQSKQQLRAVQRRAEQLRVEQCAPPPLPEPTAPLYSTTQ